jgi:hypothetical protein
MGNKKTIYGGKAVSHFSQLRKGSIYLAKGVLARFTGDTKKVGLLRRERPVFSSHGKRYTAKVTEISTVDGDGVRAYLGRREDEPLRGTNDRVQASLSAPMLAEFEKVTKTIKVR